MRAVWFAVVAALLAAPVVAISSARPLLAQAPPSGEESTSLLAAADIAAGRDSVVIEIPRNNGRVRALRLVAAGSDVTVVRAVVTYGNGQVHFEDRGRPFRLARGERTREIDRRQEERFVDTVEIRLGPGQGAARIEIWAVQSREGAAATRDGASPVARGPAPPATRGVPPPATRGPTLPDIPGPPPSTAEGPIVGSPPRSVAPPAATRPTCTQDICAEVAVLFGTDRRRETAAADAKRAFFGAEPGQRLSLGRAVVSIPTRGRTVKGRWSRPDLDFIVWRLPRREDWSRDFTLLAVEAMDRDAFVAASQREFASRGQRRAFVFVHGYNVSFDDALFRAAQIAHDTAFDGVPITYSWPSKAGIFDYNTDSTNAFHAAKRLQEFLELVTSSTGATEVHLVAHSMGTNPLLVALENIARGQRRETRFGQVVLAAPDILRGQFADLVSAVRTLARGLTLYASDNDRALRLSGLNKPNEFPVGLIRDGGPPIIVDGVHSVDVSRLNTGGFSTNHSTFAEREALMNDMAALFTGGARYPHERNRSFSRLEARVPPGGVYWKWDK